MRLNIDLTQGKEKRNVFFTSDFHLFHNNVLRFDNRPFIDVYEMHQVIEERWNEIVGPNDIVIYLGDLSFARGEDKPSVEGMMYRLNGHIHFVLGNHDKIDEIKKIGKFESVQDYLEVRIAHMSEDPYHVGLMKRTETLFTCMHYPIYSWNKKHFKSIMIHGHSHMALSDGDFHKNNRIIDVGCMGYNYYPISFYDVIKIIDDKNIIEVNHHDKNNL
jgi:calcineurin-like phosphoesterase family protein